MFVPELKIVVLKAKFGEDNEKRSFGVVLLKPTLMELLKFCVSIAHF